jgi:hypothetical protein
MGAIFIADNADHGDLAEGRHTVVVISEPTAATARLRKKRPTTLYWRKDPPFTIQLDANRMVK